MQSDHAKWDGTHAWSSLNVVLRTEESKKGKKTPNATNPASEWKVDGRKNHHERHHGFTVNHHGFARPIVPANGDSFRFCAAQSQLLEGTSATRVTTPVARATDRSVGQQREHN